ncbi:unknown [Dialister sp. CAG:588]|nr:unknown [Dialister sp. CAG:588]
MNSLEFFENQIDTLYERVRLLKTYQKEQVLNEEIFQDMKINSDADLIEECLQDLQHQIDKLYVYYYACYWKEFKEGE